MDFARITWEIFFIRSKHSPIVIDSWLDNSISHISKANLPVLDIGCGSGNNTKLLLEKGFDVISCDYSISALKKVEKTIKNAKTKFVDIREVFPFKTSSIKCVIADLSLHYFSWEKTCSIVQEIYRVLIPTGFFAFRVNSINDLNYGAGKGKEVEKHLYKWRGLQKRFFDKEDIFALIDEKWKILEISEENLDRYGKRKIVWKVFLERK